jgi:hypothetical protein
VVDEGHWQSIDRRTPKYNVMWATKTSPVDIAQDKTLETEFSTESLSITKGTVLGIIECAPHSKVPMHRTQSLDYGVVIDGGWNIQRGTMHQWNNHTGNWSRMGFVLMDSLPLEVAGQTYAGEFGKNHIKEIARRS